MSLAAPSAPPTARRGRRKKPSGVSLFAYGEPMVWLTGGALVLCLAMILGLLTLIVFEGTRSLWPLPLVELKTESGRTVLGELTRVEMTSAVDGEEPQRRRLLRLGNLDLSDGPTPTVFQWFKDSEVASESQPPHVLTIERYTWGRFYGFPKSLEVDGEPVATGFAQILEKLPEDLKVVDRLDRRQRQLQHQLGMLDQQMEQQRLAQRKSVIESGGRSAPSAAPTESPQAEKIRAEIDDLRRKAGRYVLRMQTADGKEKAVALSQIVRVYPANLLDVWGKWKVYLDRTREFIFDDPREANSEGGVFPALWGTLVMTLFMSLAVAPFGVLAALYLREYASEGWTVSVVRIAVNNLAGVPSIVFGVFGLGFFCYTMGASIDQLFFYERLPSPTFGKGGLLWASLTLALLTLPVVIVSTEEALAAVPRSMREGSYACGASKWQTIERIVLPRALPGIMTGMILAMARGAGEVAPLMLVGAAKQATDLPVDLTFPFVHPDRSFMHLGFHIFDLGFQSRDSEAAKPMVFATTLLLIVMIACLNIAAVRLRIYLRRRYAMSKF